MKPQIGNTYKGDNGKFTSVYYKRDGGWHPGIWDRQTGKRTYGIAQCTSGAAAETSMQRAKEAAGVGAEMILPEWMTQ